MRFNSGDADWRWVMIEEEQLIWDERWAQPALRVN